MATTCSTDIAVWDGLTGNSHDRLQAIIGMREMTATAWQRSERALTKRRILTTGRAGSHHPRQSYPSMIATARVQPAEARSILTGKHDTVKPVEGNSSRLCSFS